MRVQEGQYVRAPTPLPASACTACSPSPDVPQACTDRRGKPKPRIDTVFTVKNDAYLPARVASQTSKTGLDAYRLERESDRACPMRPAHRIRHSAVRIGGHSGWLE